MATIDGDNLSLPLLDRVIDNRTGADVRVGDRQESGRFIKPGSVELSSIEVSAEGRRSIEIGTRGVAYVR